MRVPKDAEKDFVAGAFILREGRVLFLKHEKYDVWLQPGGHVEESETPDEAALREVREETGFDVEILEDFKPTTEFQNESYNLPKPFNVNVHRVEKGHWHCDFLYVVRIVENLGKGEYSEEDMKWFSRENLENEDFEIPGNARKTALKVLDEYSNRKKS